MPLRIHIYKALKKLGSDADRGQVPHEWWTGLDETECDALPEIDGVAGAEQASLY